MTIAKHRNIDLLAVFGGVAGGPHARACAVLLPDLIVAAAAAASPAPNTTVEFDWFEGMGEAENALHFQVWNTNYAQE